MFSTNNGDGLEPLSIYLIRPDGTVLGCIDSFIESNSAKLTINLIGSHELKFTLTEADYVMSNGADEYQGDVQTFLKDFYQEGMYLFVSNIGYFKMEFPTTDMTGFSDSREVTAHSCDIELTEKICNLSINTAKEASMEMIVTYDDDETELLKDPYRGVPYDWIVIYNTFPKQLNEFKAKCKNGYFGGDLTNKDLVVTSKALIEEIREFVNTIPRIRRKLVDNSSDGSGDYTAIEYIVYEYTEPGDDATVNKITMYKDLNNRIDELVNFYAKYGDQLSLLSLILEKTDGNWTVGDVYGVDNGDYSLANRKYQFEIDENVGSFLTNTLASTSNCVITFDIMNRKVNIVPVESLGEDTGIVMSYENLLSKITNSCDESSLCTRLYVTGKDDIGIGQVNFGKPYIDDLSYKMNAKSESGLRIYVSDDLAAKYQTYVDSLEGKREQYINYSSIYNQKMKEIDEIKYRVPADSVKTDWSTFTKDELDGQLKAYKNLRATLISLYKEQFGSAGMNADGSVNETYLKSTFYWQDYYAYNQTIKEIECALVTFPYYNSEEKWTDEQLAEYKDAIKAWETEWSLYGTIELQAKIDSYKQNMDVLAESSVIRKKKSNGTTTDEIYTWDQLTAKQKAEYGNLAFNYHYDEYQKYLTNYKSASTYLESLKQQINSLQSEMDETQNARIALAKSVEYSSYFTDDECKTINRLISESEYQNENILVTSLNDTVSSLDVMRELLVDGQEYLSKLCRPQINFKVDTDNFLAMIEYEPFWNDFEVGNFVAVQYRDNTYAKLRVVSYAFNPCIPSDDLEITFSNFIRSKSGASDYESIFGNNASSSGGGDGSTRGGLDGTYGESDDIDVTISNIMLAQLLNSEEFGSRVKNVILDTIDANQITAKYATFGGLYDGTTTIDGECITTGYIRDKKYNASVDGDVTNTKGSILNLETGYFNFGGGKIVYDGSSLSVYADTIILGSSNVSTAISDAKKAGTNAQSTANTALNTANSATTKINNLAVGGENLLPHTKTFGYWSMHSECTLNLDETGFTFVAYPAVDTLAWRSLFNSSHSLPYSTVRNKTVTLSFEAKSPDAATMNSATGMSVYAGFELFPQGSSSRSKYRSFSANIMPTITSSWQKFTATTTLTDESFTAGTGDVASTDDITVCFYNHSLYRLHIRKPKLEIGNVSTDWSAALSDLSQNGTNIATGTRTMSIIAGSTNATGGWVRNDDGCTVENVTLSDCPVKGVSKGVKLTLTVANALKRIRQNSYTFTKGTPVTISAWVKPSASGMIAQLIPFWSSDQAYAGKQFYLTTGWQQISVTATVRTTETMSLGYVGVKGAIDQYMYIAAVKVEVGDYASEWSQAPQDDAYISIDSTGLMVADMRSGYKNPSEATARNVFVNPDSVDIRNGTNVLASFGTEIQLGQSSDEYAKLTSDGLRVYNGSTNVASFINTGVTLYASGTSMVNINATDGIRVGATSEPHIVVGSTNIQFFRKNASAYSAYINQDAIRLGNYSDECIWIGSSGINLEKAGVKRASFSPSGVTLYQDGTAVATFGSTTRIGKTAGDNITITSSALNINHGSDWVVRVSSANSDDIRMESTNEIRIFKEDGAGFVHQFGNGDAATSHVVKFGIKDISGTKRKGIEDYTNAKSTWLLYWDGTEPTYGTVGTSLRTSGEFRSTYGDIGLIHTHTNGKSLGFGIGSGGTNRGMYDRTNGKWLFYTSSDTAADVTANAPLFVNGRIRSGKNEDAYQLGYNASTSTSTAVSVSSNSWTDANTLTIHRGAWLITGEVKFAGAANKRRGVRIAYGSSKSVFEASSMVVGASTSSQTIYVSTTIHGRWSADTPIYLQAYQDSGAAINATYSTIKATFLGYY